MQLSLEDVTHISLFVWRRRGFSNYHTQVKINRGIEQELTTSDRTTEYTLTTYYNLFASSPTFTLPLPNNSLAEEQLPLQLQPHLLEVMLQPPQLF